MFLRGRGNIVKRRGRLHIPLIPCRDTYVLTRAISTFRFFNDESLAVSSRGGTCELRMGCSARVQIMRQVRQHVPRISIYLTTCTLRSNNDDGDDSDILLGATRFKTKIRGARAASRHALFMLLFTRIFIV